MDQGNLNKIFETILQYSYIENDLIVINLLSHNIYIINLYLFFTGKDINIKTYNTTPIKQIKFSIEDSTICFIYKDIGNKDLNFDDDGNVFYNGNTINAFIKEGDILYQIKKFFTEFNKYFKQNKINPIMLPTTFVKKKDETIEKKRQKSLTKFDGRLIGYLQNPYVFFEGSDNSISGYNYNESPFETLDCFLKYFDKFLNEDTRLYVIYNTKSDIDYYTETNILKIYIKYNNNKIYTFIYPKEYYHIWVNEKDEYDYYISKTEPIDTIFYSKCLNVYKGDNTSRDEGKDYLNFLKSVVSNYTNKCFYIIEKPDWFKCGNYKLISNIPIETDDIVILAFFNWYISKKHKRVCEILKSN